MIAVLKKMRYEQLIFPKKTRNEKTLQEIRKASLSLYKVHEKLKGCDTIEKEISKNKKLENGQTQTQTKNFDIFLKVKEQSLIAKINKTVYDINSVQLPMFDDIFNKISLEKRTKKLIQKIRLTKGLEKKIRIITSNGKVDDVETLKNRKVTKEF
jgi:HD-GYP domain-containing protein (c-di-GMP phosphodiesterase class II)